MSHRGYAHLRANIVGYVALFVALSGTAYAVNGPLGGRNTVGTADIINNEVRSKDVAVGAIGTTDVASDASPKALTGSNIAPDSLGGGDIDEATLFNDNSLNGGDIDESGLSGIGPGALGEFPSVRAIWPTEGSNGFTCPNQEIASGVLEELKWGLVLFETGGQLHVSNPNGSDCSSLDATRAKLTAPRDGTYLLTAGVLWPGGSAGGTRYLGIQVFDGINNPNIVADERAANQATGAGSTAQSVATLYRLSQGQQVQAVVKQDSGSPIQLPIQDSRIFFAANWVAP